MLTYPTMMEDRRGQCMLVWDSCTDLARPRVTNASQDTVTNKRDKCRSCPQRRWSSGFVTSRVSFYEFKEGMEVKLAFNDHATTTFEYETEEDALALYLHEHPDERAAMEKEQLLEQEQHTNVAPDSPNDLRRDSPRVPDPDLRVPDPDAGMKSNTVIGNSNTGALLSYKSKMAIDFQFGVPQDTDDHFAEPEREPDQNHINDDSMQLLPADESDLDAFSAESSKADMLF